MPLVALHRLISLVRIHAADIGFASAPALTAGVFGHQGGHPVAVIEVQDSGEGAPPPDEDASPAPAEISPVTTPPTNVAEATETVAADQATSPRPPDARRARRGLIAVTLGIVGALLFTPIIVATLAALWALVTGVLAALTIADLIHQGNLLESGDAMNALSVASHIGFAALGYLGLFSSLVTLLTGLNSRGPGRLFIVPGALLTASALVLFATSIAISLPLLAASHAPRLWLIGGALYLDIDAAALAMALTSARYPQAAPFRFRLARPTAPQPTREPPALPPTPASA